jgi:hypothetical protein
MFNTVKFSMFKESQSPIGMDSGTNEILSRLKFIGRIQKGEKVNVKYMYVQPDSLLTRISRTFFATDNRMNCYNFLENTVNRSFEIITLNQNSAKISERCLVINIISDIKAALEGIENIKETYIHDIMFGCKLDTLIQETTARLVELEELLKLSTVSPSEDTIAN